MKLVAVGNLTIDEVYHGHHRTMTPGGTSFYVAATASFLDVKTRVVSSVGPDYPIRFLRWMRRKKIALFLDRSSPKTTRFRLKYSSSGERKLQLLAPGNHVPLHNIKHGNALVHLGPVYHEIDISDILWARERCKFLSLDVQGLLRRCNRNGHVLLGERTIDSSLQQCDLVKAANDEARIISGSKDPFLSAEKIASKGRGFGIVSMGREGFVISNRKKTWQVPAYPEKQVVDATGAGDSMVAGWLVSFWRTRDPVWASAVGSAVSSMIIRHNSLAKFRLSRSELLERASWVYERLKE